MKIANLWGHSRFRFWHYLYGPILVVCAYIVKLYSQWYFSDAWVFWFVICISFFLYFTFPGNVFVYGVNDFGDGDTDKFNEKKQWYEKTLSNKKNFLKNIFGVQILYRAAINIFRILAFFVYNNFSSGADIEFGYYFFNLISLIALLPFLILSRFYSIEPVRFKKRLFWDGISNVLYIITPSVLILMLIGWLSINFLFWFLAAWLRCIAMHCFSAIPDIEADAKAWLKTTAIFLGKKKSLLYCIVLYALAWILASQVIGAFGSLFGLIYVAMVALWFKYDIFKVYKYFPYINFIIWFFLCLVIYFM